MNKKIILFIISISLIFKLLILKADENTYINSENITFDKNKNIIQLSQNSKINFNNTNLLIDRGIIDLENKNIKINGNFYLSYDDIILSGLDLYGDYNLNSFEAIDVSYIYNNNFKIDSKSILKKDNYLYFSNNFITSCRLDGFFNCPTWSLKVGKTIYDFDNDKFTHTNSFLQIADYKVLYIPYFTHYGNKAPRKKGFLTPSLEFIIGKNSALIAPYYIPLTKTSDVTISPKIIFDENLNFNDNFSIKTDYNLVNYRGFLNLSLKNIKKDTESSVYSNWTIDTKQVLSNEMVFSGRGLFTNSISTSRSLNIEPVSFEDISFKLEKYNNFNINDYTKYEISSVESFDQVNKDYIPIELALDYESKLENNFFNLDTNFSIKNLQRNLSDNDSPYQSLLINFENSLIFNSMYENIFNYNTITLKNKFYDYEFNHNKSLNRDENLNSITFSSEYFYNLSQETYLRSKFIHQNIFLNTNNIINEDSNAISFNYENQFNENRNFGDDLNKNSTRLVYGFEHENKFLNQNYILKLNQSYDIKKDNNYLDKINQTSNFSDYWINFDTSANKIHFEIDSRVDYETLAKKEMNYSLTYDDLIKISTTYNETDSSAFKDLLNDTKSLKIGIEKKINQNFTIGVNSDLDLKNNYSPYSQKVIIGIEDDCSKLELRYSNTRFNDNFNTNPEEILSINFIMDYIGYLGIEQKNNLISY